VGSFVLDFLIGTIHYFSLCFFAPRELEGGLEEEVLIRIIKANDFSTSRFQKRM
jgi:hypothetical protein